MTRPQAAQAHGAEIAVADAPRIDGFHFRHFGGPDDFPAMIRVNTDARNHDGILERVTVEGIANRYANLVHSDADRDVIVAEISGEIVGYGRVEWNDNTDGARDYISFCLVHPAHRRRSIGRPMLHWQEARLLEIAREQKTDRPRFLRSFVYGRDTGAIVLLEDEGYVSVRQEAEMVRPNLDDVSEVPLPEGLELRRGVPDQARAVWDASVEIFQDHWGEVNDTPEGFHEFIGDPHFDPSLWVVGWDGDEIAGVVRNSIQEGEEPGRLLGYLDSVGVRRPWRRRGLGRAIVAESLRVLRSRGATNAALGVDLQNENAAAHLYESVGFVISTTSVDYRKPLVP